MSPRLAAREVDPGVEFRGRADVFEDAFVAVGGASVTDRASVADEQVRELLPVILGDHVHQVLLDPFGRLLAREAESPRESLDVLVDDDALDHVVAVLEDGVGRKTANVVLQHGHDVVEGIVVDTHVQRLSRRLGLTSEKTPDRKSVV